MEIFVDALLFWAAAAVIFTCFKWGEAFYEVLRAKYIVWLWKRRK